MKQTITNSLAFNVAIGFPQAIDSTRPCVIPSESPDDAPLKSTATTQFYIGLLKLALDATALGKGRALVILTGALRANSFNDYKQQLGIDAEPVKLGNYHNTQHTFDSLPPYQTLTFTVRNANDSGEGPTHTGDTIS